MIRISEMWPFNIRAKARGERRAGQLRQECLDELLQEAESQGIKFSAIYVDAGTKGENNLARIFLEEYRKQRTEHTIEFLLTPRKFPLPEDYIHWPVGRVENPEYAKYKEQARAIEDEIMDKHSQAIKELEKQATEEYEKRLKAWQATSAEEWQIRYEKDKGICPTCSGRGQYPEFGDAETGHYKKCPRCNGEGKSSLEQFKELCQPQSPSYKSSYSSESVLRLRQQIDKAIHEKLKSQEPTLLVYVRITPKKEKQ